MDNKHIIDGKYKIEFQEPPRAPRQFEVDDTFPVIFTHLDEGIKWICDFDEDGKLTSVLLHEDEKVVTYIASAEMFYEIRQDMIDGGWIRNTLPKIKIKVQSPKKPPRKERRKEAKNAKSKSNFEKKLKASREARGILKDSTPSSADSTPPATEQLPPLPQQTDDEIRELESSDEVLDAPEGKQEE